MFTPCPRVSSWFFLAGEQDVYCGMHIPECSGIHVHPASVSLYFSTCIMCFHMLLNATLVSGFTKPLHIIWQKVMQFFSKDVNLLTLRGRIEERSRDINKYFNLRKKSVRSNRFCPSMSVTVFMTKEEQFFIDQIINICICIWSHHHHV